MYHRQSLLTKQDYRRLVYIRQEIDGTQKLSDADVTFLVSELHSLPPQNTSPNEATALSLVFSHIQGSKPKLLTSVQSRRLYDAIVPYLRSPDQWTQVAAAGALASTHDPRAVSRLESLAWSSPSLDVRSSVGDDLLRLQRTLLVTGKPRK
jgi:hypothetical protein